MTWKYEADPRNKHKRGWTEDTAGFVEGDGGEFVGKCPSGLSMDAAEELLNDPDAIPVFPKRWEHDYPTMILNIHDGVLYRATWTVPGVSCHGFPESPERAQKLPKAVRMQILELAERRQCEDKIRKCLKGKG